MTTAQPATAPPSRHANDLKLCPWCGGPADIEEIGGKDGAGASFSVGCHDGDRKSVCFGFQSLTTFARKSDAIAAWNRRAAIPGDKAELDATLREIERRLHGGDISYAIRLVRSLLSKHTES